MSADPPRADEIEPPKDAPNGRPDEPVPADDSTSAAPADAETAANDEDRSPEAGAAASPFADLAPRPVPGPVPSLVPRPEGSNEPNTDTKACVPTVPALGSLAESLAHGPDDGAPAPKAEPDTPRLYGTADNPVPPDARVEFVTTPDGIRLRVAAFRATRRPIRGTVILLQGRNECIEKYMETARDLAARGFASVTFDWRGQGGSERLLRDPQRGYVRSFRDYETDLMTVLDGFAATVARPPLTIVAHSSGGLTALLAAPRLTGRIERIVALAPLVRLVGLPVGQRALKWAMALARLVGLGRFYAAGGPRPEGIPDFLTNVLSTDPVRHERNGRMFDEHRHLGLGGPTVAWVHSACRAMERLASERHLRTVRVPSLLIAAGDDDVVSTAAQERLVRRMRNANMLTIDGARHELLQERDRYREQVLAAIDAFAARDEVRASETPLTPA